MGHSFHGLYVSFLLGGVQTQFIDRVSFEETPGFGLLVRVYARNGRIRLRFEDHDRYFDEESRPKPKISKYEIDFRLDGHGFKVTPETAAAARLFGAR
jgi:hypothetical protein